MTRRSVDIRICGIPCSVDFNVYGPEPDVGINTEWVEDWWITHINGRKVKGKGADWLYKKITDKKDDDRVIESIMEAYDVYED